MRVQDVITRPNCTVTRVSLIQCNWRRDGADFLHPTALVHIPWNAPICYEPIITQRKLLSVRMQESHTRGHVATFARELGKNAQMHKCTRWPWVTSFVFIASNSLWTDERVLLAEGHSIMRVRFNRETNCRGIRPYMDVSCSVQYEWAVLCHVWRSAVTLSCPL
jgi:hypothetical protein